jgi:hypothetical protein
MRTGSQVAEGGGERVRKAARPDRSAQIEAVEGAFKDGRLSKEVYEQAQKDLRRLEAQEKAREERVSRLSSTDFMTTDSTVSVFC